VTTTESDETTPAVDLPEFELELPPGWARHDVSDESLEALLAATKRRCMENHQVELYATLKNMLEVSFKDMRAGGVFAYFTPSEPGSGTLAIPVSIHASVRRAEAGQSLDDLVRMMIAHHGAQPLLGDTRTVRLEQEREMVAADGTVINHSVVYLTPVPGSRRSRALQLVAAFPRDPAEAADSDETNGIRALIDTCVATLRWSSATEPPVGA